MMLGNFWKKKTMKTKNYQQRKFLDLMTSLVNSAKHLNK